MLISFCKAFVSDSPLHQNLHLQSLDSTFDGTEREKKIISVRIQSHSRSANPAFLPIDHFESESFLILSLSLSLVFGFGLFRETNSAHAVMTSSRLHFTLDKTALTCCIHSLEDMQSLQSDAIRSSCTSVPRRGLQSYDAYGDIRVQCRKRTCTHSEESVHSGREGGAYIEHSGRQHDHQYHEHQEPHYL